ncbi:hypothetical protein GCM10010124_29080 [Pilimelia terevasa]|uniref:Histidine kinase/HSP90-like ATPase domain-containing protein n=1 Tax=Pilimelia terevasa TaxID=53372 RepID=A0A8J3BNL8_9ACTN|nr:ATP-binding protein [Pilimelia terevasa]GGK34588.1 hypothetical protein GCM10010124_29080 [Pilimelia terevasa]
MSELNAEFDLPDGPEAIAFARHAGESILRGWGFADEDWLYDASVIVSELVSNAVRHGGGSLVLLLQAHERNVTLTVADGSVTAPRRRDGDDDGGRGMAIIEAMGAGWGVADHEGGKRVWVRLSAHPA